ncbi:MAG: hypothetical protein AAF716_12065 [Cyanobacteria bacterium P01_D01_bin.1]
MNTPAHAIFNLALLGRQKKPQWNPLIVWGALIPDLAMFGFYFWLKVVRGLPSAQIWRTEYYKPAWQLLFDLFNSIPLALVGVGVMIYAQRTGIALLFVSVVLHCLEDLPVHHDDAHRHFWPLSNFRFESPVSYWDPNHYGDIVSRLEVVLVLAASVYVFGRVRSRWAKALVVLANLLPFAAYLYFSISIT